MNSVIVKSSPVQGKGVFSTKNLTAGEVILKIDDSHVVTDQSALTTHQQEYDCDYLANGKVVLMQAPEKYINHSCDPTAYVKTIKGVRKVMALKNINENEEITFDYAINGDNEGTFVCNCGTPNCRKMYNGNFFKLPKSIQLKYLPYLDDWFVAEHSKEIDKLKRA